MKKIFIVLTLLTTLFSTQTHTLSKTKATALMKTILGGGTVGLTASLLQDASGNLVIQGAKYLCAQAGCGSFIRQIRLQMQQLITQMHSGSVQNTLNIEKVVYITIGLIGAAFVLEGLSDLLSDS